MDREGILDLEGKLCKIRQEMHKELQVENAKNMSNIPRNEILPILGSNMRDDFAGRAMTGLLIQENEMLISDLAEKSYIIADEMIKARAKALKK